MKITLKTAWISTSGHSDTEAVMDVEGVGETKIILPLPEDLLARVEEYYRSVLLERYQRATSFCSKPASSKVLPLGFHSAGMPCQTMEDIYEQ